MLAAFLISGSANTVNEDELDLFNEVVPDEEVKDTHKTYEENANNLKETHRDLKETYDALEAKTSKGKNRREFVEPKVLNLWNAAIESNFTAQELNSLKVILKKSRYVYYICQTNTHNLFTGRAVSL